MQRALCLFAPAILGPLIAAGCAQTTYRAMDDGQEAKARGVRYYETSPFLLVKTDNAGGVEAEVLYLPDTEKMRQVQISAYLATNNTTLDFDNGVLTSAKSEIDDTVVPAAAVSALADIAKAAISAAANSSRGPLIDAPAPYLFRINVKSDGTFDLSGGQADVPVKVKAPE